MAKVTVRRLKKEQAILSGCSSEHPHRFGEQMPTSEWIAADEPFVWARVAGDDAHAAVYADSGHGYIAIVLWTKSRVAITRDFVLALGDYAVLDIQNDEPPTLYKRV